MEKDSIGNFIKNLKIWKSLNSFNSKMSFVKSAKAVVIAMSLSVAAFISGCSKGSETVDVSLEEVVNANLDNTDLDELTGIAVPICDSVNTYSNTLREDTKKLENYLELVDEIESLGVESYDPLDVVDLELVANLNGLSKQEVLELIEEYQDENLTYAQKENIGQTLSYLSMIYKTWIDKEGLEIVEELLLMLIKLDVCKCVGIDSNNYRCCKIGFDDPERDFMTRDYVEVKNSFGYVINTVDITSKSGIVHDALYALSDVQCKVDNVDDKVALCKRGLNEAKLLIVSGCELNEDNVMSSTISREEALEELSVIAANSKKNNKGVSKK